MTDEPLSQWRAWLIAIRPHTLPAGIAPVLVGIGIAVVKEVFALWPAIAALGGALLIQIGTNLANDYYDAQRGVDTNDRTGFTRVTHRGLISPDNVKRGMIVSFLAAIAVGTYLVWVGGFPIVVIGLLSVICGIAYAGGPFPFGSYGLGDLFVFVFFGVIAVTGTYYVQAASILSDPLPIWIHAAIEWELAIASSIPIARISTAILVVNNYRDIDTDRQAGKQTLAVILGPRWTRWEYAGLMVTAYTTVALMAFLKAQWALALPILTLPYAAWLTRRVMNDPSSARLNSTLTHTGRLLVLVAIMLTVGLVIS